MKKWMEAEEEGRARWSRREESQVEVEVGGAASNSLNMPPPSYEEATTLHTPSAPHLFPPPTNPLAPNHPSPTAPNLPPSNPSYPSYLSSSPYPSTSASSFPPSSQHFPDSRPPSVHLGSFSSPSTSTTSPPPPTTSKSPTATLIVDPPIMPVISRASLESNEDEDSDSYTPPAVLRGRPITPVRKPDGTSNKARVFMCVMAVVVVGGLIYLLRLMFGSLVWYAS